MILKKQIRLISYVKKLEETIGSFDINDRSFDLRKLYYNLHEAEIKEGKCNKDDVKLLIRLIKKCDTFIDSFEKKILDKARE